MPLAYIYIYRYTLSIQFYLFTYDDHDDLDHVGKMSYIACAVGNVRP